MKPYTANTQDRVITFACELKSSNQVANLESWIADGCPTEMIQLGRSCGCASARGNFHSTWALLSDDGSVVVWRVYGDPRGAWNKYKAWL